MTASPYDRRQLVAARVPTEKQYRTLRNLGSGAAGLSWGKRDTEPFLRRGWVVAEWKPPYYQWVRITPDGLRALAAAVERYGLPDIGHQRQSRICSGCARDWNPRCDCGSRTYHYHVVDVEIPASAGSTEPAP